MLGTMITQRLIFCQCMCWFVSAFLGKHYGQDSRHTLITIVPHSDEFLTDQNNCFNKSLCGSISVTFSARHHWYSYYNYYHTYSFCSIMFGGMWSEYQLSSTVHPDRIDCFELHGCHCYNVLGAIFYFRLQCELLTCFWMVANQYPQLCSLGGSWHPWRLVSKSSSWDISWSWSQTSNFTSSSICASSTKRFSAVCLRKKNKPYYIIISGGSHSFLILGEASRPVLFLWLG